MKKTMLAFGVLFGMVGMPLASLAESDPAVIEASRSEDGILVYTTGNPKAWTPFLEAFNAKYPWIKVETLELGGNEIWERFYAEAATGVHTADVITGGSPNKFVEAYDKGALLDYVPVGFEELPVVPEALPGLTLISADAQVMMYNKALLPEELWPTSFTNLADKVAANPDIFNGKVTTFDPIDSSVGPGMHMAMARVLGEDYWTAIEKLAPAMRYESGGSVMLDKVTSGEYLVGFFVTSSLVVPQMTESRAKIVNWGYFNDATPFQVRTISIPKAAVSVNSAMVFTDYLTSLEGQQAYGLGGPTTFHPDVVPGNGVTTYQQVLEAIGGEEHAAMYAYEREFFSFEENFKPRLEEALGR